MNVCLATANCQTNVAGNDIHKLHQTLIDHEYMSYYIYLKFDKWGNWQCYPLAYPFYVAEAGDNISKFMFCYITLSFQKDGSVFVIILHNASQTLVKWQSVYYGDE